MPSPARKAKAIGAIVMRRQRSATICTSSASSAAAMYDKAGQIRSRKPHRMLRMVAPSPRPDRRDLMANVTGSRWIANVTARLDHIQRLAERLNTLAQKWPHPPCRQVLPKMSTPCCSAIPHIENSAVTGNARQTGSGPVPSWGGHSPRGHRTNPAVRESFRARSARAKTRGVPGRVWNGDFFCTPV